MKLRAEQIQAAVGVLKSLPLFAGSPDPAMAQLAERIDSRETRHGRVVMMDQEINRTLYVLVKGIVSVHKRIDKENRELARLTAPNFFGERSMFEDAPASALVKTEDDCQIYAIEKAAFDQMFAAFPDVKETVRKNMETIRSERKIPLTQKPR